MLIAAPLLWLASSSGGLPLWAVWLLLARELLISGWRSQASRRRSCVPRRAKLKTILQFVSLLLLLWPPDWVAMLRWLQNLGWWLFWPSLAAGV